MTDRFWDFQESPLKKLGEFDLESHGLSEHQYKAITKMFLRQLKEMDTIINKNRVFDALDEMEKRLQWMKRDNHEGDNHEIARYWIRFVKDELGIIIKSKKGSQCFYTPASHTVTMGNSVSDSSYVFLTTLIHETVHWASKGCGVNLAIDENDWRGRAREELVAELGTFMLCGVLDVDVYLRSMANNFRFYLKAWIEHIEDDPDMLRRSHKDAIVRVRFLTTGFIPGSCRSEWKRPKRLIDKILLEKETTGFVCFYILLFLYFFT